jgi:hypothetical protein
MTQELERLTLRRRHRGSAAAHNFLNGLVSNGINSQQVLDVLRGDKAPHVDVFDLHCEWALAAQTYYDNQARRQALTSLNGEYRKIRNFEEPILRSPLVSKVFKDALKSEFETIRSILLSLNSCPTDDDSRPLHPFTVGLFEPRQRRKGSDWSRHSFWNTVISALRSTWHKAGKTDYQAFKDIAQLLALFFPPFPNDPSLIKRRYYHSMH